MQCLAWFANPLLAVQFHRRRYLKQVQPLAVSTQALVAQNQSIGSNQDRDYMQFMTRDNPGDGVSG